MANIDKNIIITPNIGSSTDDPKIVFSGADATLGPQNITLKAYSTNNGTLSFEGSAGQLFSITNSLTGTIFSVNDISGIPSIEVLDDGTVKLAQYNGTVKIGGTTAVKLPVGTTAQRPTGEQGMLRYSNTTYNFEGYNGSQWFGFGYTGSGGLTGFTGSVGVTGFTGSASTVIGYTGSASTVIGYTGSVGFVGSASTVIGYSGSVGTPGFTGSAGSGGSVTTSITPPVSPTDGTLWWNEEEGQLKIYYAENGFTGSSAQWVDANASAVGQTGYTGSRGALSQWTVKTANYTAVDGDRFIANTTTGSFTVTLPATPTTGTYIQITDGGNWYTNNLLINRNGSTIEGIVDDLIVNIPNVVVEFIYDGTTWQFVCSAGPEGPVGPTNDSSAIVYSIALG